MMTGIKVISCLVIASLIGGIVAAAGVPFVKKEDVPDLQEMLGSSRTAIEMRLHSAARDPSGKSVSDKTLAYDYRGADGKSKVRSQITYQSGATEEIFYRANESKEWSRDYYPLQAGEILPVLRSIARFAADGSTYESHDVRRIDGSWERRGKLLADGNYEQVYFCQDGKTPHTVRLFDKDKRFKSEKAIFCSTGKPIRETESGDYGSKILTLFNEDGSIAVKMKMEDGGEAGAIIKGDVYDKAGKAVVHFNSTGYGATVTKTVNGQVVEWNDNIYMNHTRDITVYDRANPKRKLYTQTFDFKESFKPEKGLVLVKVVEFDKNNTQSREIEFDKKSGKALKVTVSISSAKKVVYTLDQSGKTIVKAESLESGKTSDANLPADRIFNLEAEKLTARERPHYPEWDDGNTATKEKVYDYF